MKNSIQKKREPITILNVSDTLLAFYEEFKFILQL